MNTDAPIVSRKILPPVWVLILLSAELVLNHWLPVVRLKPFTASTTLLVAGPYRFSRNPMYLGMAALLLGAAVVMGSLTPFVGPVLFVLIILFRFIRPEEVHMERAFGTAYLDLKKKVRRWL